MVDHFSRALNFGGDSHQRVITGTGGHGRGGDRHAGAPAT
jgi:hypothetical protein